jgi:hypothetical protein
MDSFLERACGGCKITIGEDDKYIQHIEDVESAAQLL